MNMLVNKNFIKDEKEKKIGLGQFFTKESLWLKPQIIDFIKNSNCFVAYDPFAGAGDLLKHSHLYGISKTKGLDIDASLNWEINDGLINIPHIDNAIIITNPPYLSNYSASRKKIISKVEKYFKSSEYDDLYLIALSKMLEAQDYVVAIIPETFINSSFKQKNRLFSITILEENPFEDTDTPVCVVCFDNKIKDISEVLVYKNEDLVSTLGSLESFRLIPNKKLKIAFNIIDAWLGLRAVDTTDPKNMIKFDFKENFDYDWGKGIKTSSRLLSVIDISIPENDRQKFIDLCNNMLFELRLKTKDIILSPFKGNMKNGIRRRRLDFNTARAIMEQAYYCLYGGELLNEQLRLF